MDKVKKLSEKDMSRILNAKNKVTFVTTVLDKAIAEAKVAELEYNNVVQKIYLENSLNIACKIQEDGTVTWPAEKLEEMKVVENDKQSLTDKDLVPKRSRKVRAK